MMRSVRQKNGEAGSALVEFALATVIILTVLFGIIAVSYTHLSERCNRAVIAMTKTSAAGSRGRA